MSWAIIIDLYDDQCRLTRFNIESRHCDEFVNTVFDGYIAGSIDGQRWNKKLNFYQKKTPGRSSTLSSATTLDNEMFGDCSTPASVYWGPRHTVLDKFLGLGGRVPRYTCAYGALSWWCTCLLLLSTDCAVGRHFSRLFIYIQILGPSIFRWSNSIILPTKGLLARFRIFGR